MWWVPEELHTVQRSATRYGHCLQDGISIFFVVDVNYLYFYLYTRPHQSSLLYSAEYTSQKVQATRSVKITINYLVRKEWHVTCSNKREILRASHIHFEELCGFPYKSIPASFICLHIQYRSSFTDFDNLCLLTSPPVTYRTATCKSRMSAAGPLLPLANIDLLDSSKS